MTFSIENFEVFLLILVRITGFIFTAPFFSLTNVPIRIKSGLSIFLAAILFYSNSYNQPEYVGIIGYSILVVSEAMAGAIMGFFANVAYYIINFSGQLLDMQIGFSMASQFDPISHSESTVSTSLYSYLIIVIMIITNMHHIFVRALIESFQIIKIGEVYINPGLYRLMMQFVTDYFIIGFRIVLPVFAAILMVDTLLAVLVKVAPQMNMFAIGMQIRIFVGLIVLILIISFIPSVADSIFREMVTMLKSSVSLLH